MLCWFCMRLRIFSIAIIRFIRAFNQPCRPSPENFIQLNQKNLLPGNNQRPLTDFVAELGDDGLFFKYENMVDKKFDALNEYLGLKVKEAAEVPKASGKSKVVRK